ncbi:MAG TPA: hypothetical protein VI542_07365 [Candidatus Tectomicrobia bacterium]
MPQQSFLRPSTFDAVRDLSQELLEALVAQYCDGGRALPPYPYYAASWDACMPLMFTYHIELLHVVDSVTHTLDICLHPYSKNWEEEAPLYTVGTEEEARRVVCEIALWTVIGDGSW